MPHKVLDAYKKLISEGIDHCPFDPVDELRSLLNPFYNPRLSLTGKFYRIRFSHRMKYLLRRAFIQDD